MSMFLAYVVTVVGLSYFFPDDTITIEICWRDRGCSMETIKLDFDENGNITEEAMQLLGDTGYLASDYE